MLAALQKVDDSYIARFDRPLKHSVEKVWAALTENNKLQRWMPNLQIESLRNKGIIKFDMQDGSGKFINMEITNFESLSILEFIWGNDRVRFELYPKSDGCLLVMKEFIGTLNDHTPKDLAGWHVCLDVLLALLEGQFMDFPKDSWQKWYEEYMDAVKQLQLT